MAPRPRPDLQLGHLRPQSPAPALSAPPIPPRLPRRSVHFVWLIVGAVLVALILAAVGWNFWTIRQLEAAQQRLRTAGLPTRIDDVRPPPVADSDNAAPLIAQLAKIIESPAFTGAPDREKGVESRLFELRQRHPDGKHHVDDAADLRAILAEPTVIEVLSLAHAAAAKPAYDAKLDYRQGVALNLPFIGPFRTTAELLRARAWLSAHDGNTADACVDLRAIFHLARFLGSEPTLLSQLARVALHGIALDALEHTVRLRPLSADWNLRFRDHLLETELQTGLLRALDAERIVFGEDAFGMLLRKGDLPTALADILDIKPLRKIPFVLPGLVRLEHAEYLDRMREFRLATAELWPDPVAQARRTRAISDSIPRYRLLVRMVLPTLATVIDKAQTYQTKLTVTAAALALQQHYSQHATVPDSLAEIDPAFPREKSRDPFSGRPLLLRRDENTVTVYSIGKNRRDDAGRFAPDEGVDDPAFTVPLK